MHNSFKQKDDVKREFHTEPVAWLYERPSGAAKLSFVQEKMLWEDITETPLYTHPAKTLTDEEIVQVAESSFTARDGKKPLIEFARAILKKASEK